MDHTPEAPRERRFHCPACGHHMAYGALRCDGCNEEAPVYNRPVFWTLTWLSGALTVVAVIALIVT